MESEEMFSMVSSRRSGVLLYDNPAFDSRTNPLYTGNCYCNIHTIICPSIIITSTQETWKYVLVQAIKEIIFNNSEAFVSKFPEYIETIVIYLAGSN